MMKRFITALASVCLYAITSKADDLPKTMTLYIGGWDGPSYSVTLTNDVVVYREGGGGPLIDKAPEQVISPRAEQWKQFRTDMDTIEIWNWKTNYIDHDVLDGTQWRVEITYSNRSITAEGSNAYPGSSGPEISTQFRRFLEAVRKLINGKPFG